MSAELLREAAAKMRQVAEEVAAQPQTTAQVEGIWLRSRYNAVADPAFLRAVADWLDHMAARAELKAQRGGNRVAVWAHERHAIAVASAYLGRDQ